MSDVNTDDRTVELVATLQKLLNRLIDNPDGAERFPPPSPGSTHATSYNYTHEILFDKFNQAHFSGLSLSIKIICTLQQSNTHIVL